MAFANPLTINSSIQVANVNAAASSVVPQADTSARNFGEFTQDIVSISSAAREKQQQETQQKQASSNQAQQPNTDSVRVSSTIGKSRSSQNLTTQQATALYEKIANLLVG